MVYPEDNQHDEKTSIIEEFVSRADGQRDPMGPLKKMNARRLVAAKLGNDAAIVKKLFDDIAPRYATRNGGYTRMFRLGPRLGDAAEMVLLELVEE